MRWAVLDLWQVGGQAHMAKTATETFTVIRYKRIEKAASMCKLPLLKIKTNI
jgi:hypothetical protein